MGIWESALILLGIGIVSERFGAGVGLGELGTGIRTLAAAPLGGIGAGLGEFSGGLRSFGEALGDIGRGFAELFENLPQQREDPRLPRTDPDKPGWWWWGASTPLITVSGGDKTSLDTGGGGNVPRNGPILTLGGAGAAANGFTGTHSQALVYYQARGLSLAQAHSLTDPLYDRAAHNV